MPGLAVIWTRRGIRRLGQKATEAMRRIEDLFSRTVLNIDGLLAWGQFLDGPRQQNQFGIYGTSAAIQVLAAAGFPPENRLIEQALEGLPLVDPRSEAEKRYDVADAFLTHKAAFLLSAAQPGGNHFTIREPIEDRILDRIIDSRGWGDYAFPQGQDNVPNVLATATTLLALARDREFRSTERCESTLRWLCRSIRNDGGLLAHENAVAALALVSYTNPGEEIEDYEPARDICVHRLIDWARRRDPAILGQNIEHHYWVPLPGIGRNHYMFYLPDVLVALALLRLDNPQTTRQFVLRVVNDTADNTLEHGGYKSPSNARISSVDQLWIYLLMAELSKLADADPNRLLPKLYVIATNSHLRRISLSAGLLTLGSGATALGLGTHTIGARALALGLATVVLGILATAIYSWITDRQP
jgi:hypothetical protein